MHTTVTLEHVPEDVLDQLRKRAERNQRSLNDELVAALRVVASDDLVLINAAKIIRDAGARSPHDAVAAVRLLRSGGDLLHEHLVEHWDELSRWVSAASDENSSLSAPEPTR